jgi:predicted Zn-dependent protease
VEGVPYRKYPTVSTSCWCAHGYRHANEPRDGVAFFDDILTEKKVVNEASARYGLIMALLKKKDFSRATREMNTLLAQVPDNPIVLALAGRVRAASGDIRGALDLYASAVKRFPRNRALTYDYARLLIDNKRSKDALQLIAAALDYTHSDYRLYELQAECYAHLGQKLQQHRSLAESHFDRQPAGCHRSCSSG